MRPVQAATIPAALDGRDVLGLAQTGSGKTAAFALPLLSRLLAGKRGADARALILAPTRELALQIHKEISALGKFTKLRSACIYGGVPQARQERDMQRKPDILVACPGRLLDLVGQRIVRLGSIETLVLDEADHMFDLGFLPDLRRILAAVPEKRQTLMFSATMPKEIRSLADECLNDPHVAELANAAPPSTIEHGLYPVLSTRKLDLLELLLNGEGMTSAIVFSRTKHRAKRLADQLTRSGHNAVALQGNMSQGQRDKAMNGFRQGRFKVLVATDIAARGIDVAGVSHVINFDMPSTADAYTHRIGRTGRSEQSGKAFTFVSEQDIDAVRGIERQLGKPLDRLEVDGFDGQFPLPSAAARPTGGRRRGGPPPRRRSAASW
ncbi:MAG: DEAD/DEAH box helicase [Acidobacteria bacterium]|nr:DEAD/DEAH box helicase [Acidobacteriota bacterium]